MRPFGRILILAACILGALALSSLLRAGPGASMSATPPPYLATLGTPRPYNGGTSIAYQVTLDDEKLRPFLEALQRVDRARLGFRQLSSGITYDLSLNYPDDRDADAGLIGNADSGSVAISFVQQGGVWRWSGEELLMIGPGRYWMGWDEGYWREGASFSCFGECAADPDVARVTVAYSGTSVEPAFPWNYLLPPATAGQNSLNWQEAKDRMDSWHPGATAP